MRTLGLSLTCANEMSSNYSSRGSSALFVTPRGTSLDDVEASDSVQLMFQPGARMHMEAPGTPAKQQPGDQQQHWVDQQQWEQEQQMQAQQFQAQQWHDQWHHEQATGYPSEAEQTTEALTEAVAKQLQKQPMQAEDLSKMVGEGEWQKPPAKTPSWSYSRALSSYTGFTSKTIDKPATPELQTQMSGVQMQNSGIYVEGVHHWNATTNMPVQPLGQEGMCVSTFSTVKY